MPRRVLPPRVTGRTVNRLPSRHQSRGFHYLST
jgi:hypothetical protein